MDSSQSLACTILGQNDKIFTRSICFQHFKHLMKFSSRIPLLQQLLFRSMNRDRPLRNHFLYLFVFSWVSKLWKDFSLVNRRRRRLELISILLTTWVETERLLSSLNEPPFSSIRETSMEGKVEFVSVKNWTSQSLRTWLI